MASVLRNPVKISSALIKFLLLVSAIPAFAQRPSPPLATLSNWFDQTIGVENSGLINGVQYKMSFLGASSNPFFGEVEKQGTIRFKGEVYNATVLYDCYQDVVIVKHLGSSGQAWFIQPDKKSVEEFTIGNHVFRKLNDSWHEVFFESRDMKVIAKRAKRQSVNKSISNYAVNDEFFIVEGKNWTRFKTITAFAKLLPNKADKEEFNSFIKQNKIKTRKFSDDDLIKAATFVSNLRVRTSAP